MNVDDPYVLARATLQGPIYGRQLHTAPVNNLDTPVEPLTNIAMRMFAEDFPGRQHVDAAVSSINNQMLTAELKRQWMLAHKITEAGLEQEHLERRVFQLGLEQGMSCNCLQEAHTGNQVIEEMMRDMHRYTDIPIPQGCGRRGR